MMNKQVSTQRFNFCRNVLIAAVWKMHVCISCSGDEDRQTDRQTGRQAGRQADRQEEDEEEEEEDGGGEAGTRRIKKIKLLKQMKCMWIC